MLSSIGRLSMSIRAPRFVAAGALAVAAVAAPIAIALTSVEATASAAPPCLSWVGNKEDGNCLSYSNGNGVNVGSNILGIYGPNGAGGGALLPGTTWNRPGF